MRRWVLDDCSRGIFTLFVLDEGETVLVVVATLDHNWVQFAIFIEHGKEFPLELSWLHLHREGDTSTSRLVAKILWGVGFYYGSGERRTDYELDDIGYHKLKIIKKTLLFFDYT